MESNTIRDEDDESRYWWLDRSLAHWISRLLVSAILSAGPAFSDDIPAADYSAAREHLSRAFELRFDYDVVQIVRLNVYGRSGEIHRTLELAAKRVDGRLRSVGMFTEPEYLRGTKLLMIENLDRGDDFFLYLRSLKKTRRISTAQKREAFMGTDLSYEDMERRYVEDYVVEPRPNSAVGGEGVFVVHATPRYKSSYAWAEFFIAELDHAILEVRYYREHDEAPWKIQHSPRDKIVVMDGHLVPTELVMVNVERKSRTEVIFERVRIDPPLRDSLFTTAALESGRDIPHLEVVQEEIEESLPPK